MSSANLHLPQKALFSRGQCPIKGSVLSRACVTACSVSMMTCCQCPEECCGCASAVVQPYSTLFLPVWPVWIDGEMFMRLVVACSCLTL